MGFFFLHFFNVFVREVTCGPQEDKLMTVFSANPFMDDKQSHSRFNQFYLNSFQVL